MWMLRPVKEETLDGIKNKFLVKARRDFEAGNQAVILPCVSLCLWLGIQPPEWLEDAFCSRAGAPWKFEKWEDAFGPPMPKGTKKAARQEIRNILRLERKIREIRAKGVKGRDLYEQAAKELGLRGGWQTIRDAYYRIAKPIREYKESDEALPSPRKMYEDYIKATKSHTPKSS